ncbi:LuxR family transcriptional regulator [Budviciaceae bacterium BWR-B9]|uniref:LuxR family transcriptional regulator n=1 Tax=Limnobaculum allomyrinae TaxID=2791986 RepID=A0ABS1IUW8_9GAMM|nr:MULTISPECIES: LuxR family transcriptional regulator [Limnobaculum]MBK5145556.1 LuxR family transcriptional regulator [Limnobaculum allomyrinae]MBV7693674.1 LuxR family transcriptional regulator [Limnobaculum sp. M2-1]
MPDTFIPIELYETLTNSEKEKDYFEALQLIVLKLGFTYCAYGIMESNNISATPPKVLNNYPIDWADIYVKRNYFKVDPTVQHGLNSTQMLLWTPKLYEKSPEFWEEARSFKICHGISQSQKDIYGRIGMLTFASSDHNHDTKFFNQYSKTLIWLSHTSHYFLADKLLPTHIHPLEYACSTREKDILFWIAEGLTAKEISVRLSVSESTINYHIANMLKKLSVPNKAAAIAKAIITNILKF